MKFTIGEKYRTKGGEIVTYSGAQDKKFFGFFRAGPDTFFSLRLSHVKRLNPPPLQKPETMKNLLANYIDGNLAEARRAAKRHSFASIAWTLVEGWGYSAEKAGLTAHWLKTGEGYQAACDAI